jgi:hypothetical protein
MCPKDSYVYRRDAEDAEEGSGKPAARGVAWSAVMNLNPHPSHETKAGRMGHPVRPVLNLSAV